MLRIDQDGGRGIGVDPTGSDFPFVRPSADIRHILADLALTYAAPGYQLPLTVTRLNGFDAAFSAVMGPVTLAGSPVTAPVQLVIKDAGGATVFDAAAAISYRGIDISPRLRSHTWITPAAVCRAVQHTAFPDTQAAVTFPSVIAPAAGQLDARALERLPGGVKSIGDVAGLVPAATAACQFLAGYNVAIAVVPQVRGLRRVTQLVFSADPGGGAGRAPGCPDTPAAVHSINGVRPDAYGNLSLGATGCYSVRRPGIGQPPEGVLTIRNDCDPCCTCDDFVRVQTAALAVWDQFLALGTDAEAVRNDFQAVIARWQAAADCVSAQVVQVAPAAFGGQFVDLQVAVCNHTMQCLTGVAIAVQASSTAGRPVVVLPQTTTVTGAIATKNHVLEGPGPWTFHIPQIDPMGAGWIRTRLLVRGATPGTIVTVRAHARTTMKDYAGELPQTTTETTTFPS